MFFQVLANIKTAIISILSPLLQWPRLILSLAFVRKELFGTLRQPRLLLSLVVGPFVILALFGLGYFGPGNYDTILVLPNRPGISTQLDDYKSLFGNTFNLVEVTTDQDQALADLKQGDAEVVIVVPYNALDQIYNGKYASFPVYYRTLNPVDASYIEYSTYIYASEFDQVILRQALTVSKPQASQLQDATNQLNTSTNALDQSMQKGDLVQAEIQVHTMLVVVDLMQKGLAGLIIPGQGNADTTQQQLLGEALTRIVFQEGITQMQGDLTNIKDNLNALQTGFDHGDLNSPAQRAHLQSIRQSNASLTQQINKLAAIPPAVIVSPVLASASDIVSTPVTYINFYGPAVIVLLLQHMAITMASLSNVRDRMVGAFEIFRVAPISPGQILTGKFISFCLILLTLGVLLLVLVTQLLGVPFINFGAKWYWALLILLLAIYASIGFGYLLAGLSRSDSQAVQLTMLVLLASIFFTGFILPLNQFAGYIRTISYVLPITFAANLLQNLMLDNQAVNYWYLLILFGMGTVYLVVGRLLYQRQFNVA